MHSMHQVGDGGVTFGLVAADQCTAAHCDNARKCKDMDYNSFVN